MTKDTFQEGFDIGKNSRITDLHFILIMMHQ